MGTGGTCGSTHSIFLDNGGNHFEAGNLWLFITVHNAARTYGFSFRASLLLCCTATLAISIMCTRPKYCGAPEVWLPQVPHFREAEPQVAAKLEQALREFSEGRAGALPAEPAVGGAPDGPDLLGTTDSSSSRAASKPAPEPQPSGPGAEEPALQRTHSSPTAPSVSSPLSFLDSVARRLAHKSLPQGHRYQEPISSCYCAQQHAARGVALLFCEETCAVRRMRLPCLPAGYHAQLLTHFATWLSRLSMHGAAVAVQPFIAQPPARQPPFPNMCGGLVVSCTVPALLWTAAHRAAHAKKLLLRALQAGNLVGPASTAPESQDGQMLPPATGPPSNPNGEGPEQPAVPPATVLPCSTPPIRRLFLSISRSYAIPLTASCRDSSGAGHPALQPRLTAKAAVAESRAAPPSPLCPPYCSALNCIHAT